MVVRVHPLLNSMRVLLLAGVAAAALSACASNRASMAQPDFAGQSATESRATLSELAARYKARPQDKTIIIYYAAALRAAGQAEQAVSVLEAGVTVHRKDVDIRIAYAKALTAAGRFDQAMTVIEGAINPASPDWNALLVKGAILDQRGRNAEARALYAQALLAAPGEASLEANLGLSFAMTSELDKAEQHLRKAVAMRGANSQIRQNLALVIGLQGRFDEARQLFARELPADQVESNMNYIRALLTQQNRWDLIKG
jgi:Flp pilus assembly protein TadD